MPRARDLTGCVLDGRYELYEVVGEGAFGRVYRGHDRRLERDVAVKVIKPWWAEDPKWVVSFQQEAHLLARVSDPGIVQIFDVGQADEGLYYVAELVDGESLASRLRRGRLPPWHACDIAEQLCRALAHAHARRVVHRDIKPANILVSAAGRVKVGDFGVAHLADGTSQGPETVVGTPRYMAPEQARGLRTTAATDVYSVGVVLYEMLAGRPPFTDRTVVELALRHAQETPSPLPVGTPPAIVKVVERALAKDPAERYADGYSLAGALADARASALGTAHAHSGREEQESRRGAHTASRATGARRRSAAGEVPVAAEEASTARTRQMTISARTRGGAGFPRGAVARGGSIGGRRWADPLQPTRVSPRMAPRRNVNLAARRRGRAVFALVSAVVLALLAGAILLLTPGQVRVPHLRGLSRRVIATRVRRLGLRPSFSRRYDSAAAGVAVAQDPAPGGRVNDGSMVRIVLSAGPPPVEVPRVIGQSSASARTILRSLGLNAKLTTVPAPGVQPGAVTGQAPTSGKYVPASGSVALSVAEQPGWRPVTTFAGSDSEHSVQFRVRGDRWRIVYTMGYVGTCTLIIVCDGPSAQVVDASTGSSAAQFSLNDGRAQTQMMQSGPGLYEIRVAAGADTARWSFEVDDYF